MSRSGPGVELWLTGLAMALHSTMAKPSPAVPDCKDEEFEMGAV